MPETADEQNEVRGETLSSSLTWLMSIACGITVANLYYAQPLLAQMAEFWHTNESNMGSIAALFSCGYATGILLFVPLGDIFDRRRLILLSVTAISIAQLAIGFAPNLQLLALQAFLLGALTISPQLIIPFATSLSSPESRGAIVGRLMAGLLTGILLSRTFGGFVGSHFGWRSVYLIAAVINMLLLIALSIKLPRSKTSQKLSYSELMKSLLELAMRENIVQTSAFFGAMTFASFNAFWTSLTFFATANYHFSAETIGLFGLVGAVGVLAAPIAGRLADERGPLFGIGASLALVIIAYLILYLWAKNLLGLIAGIIILDLAAHSSQVSNMARIYSLQPHLYSRLNTIYMVSYFIGGSLGAWLASLSWSIWGWAGACAVGAVFPALGLVLYLFVLLSRKFEPARL